MIHLKGHNDSYSFDPSDPSSILRANGKFGSTYIGKRESDDSKVVVKQLNPALSRDEKAVERFTREAKISVDHFGLVNVLDLITEGDDHFLVREFVQGTDLSTYAKSNKVPPLVLASVILKICPALELLHKKGIVHRDIRPSNIIVGDPEIKIIDLGLAKFPDDNVSEKSPFALIYSPPEQVMNCGAAVNASSDIYSLAVTIYECMCGKVPFQHENPEMLMQLMINMPLEPYKRVPGPVFRVLSKATSKFKFPLPPNKYGKAELVKLMLKGQEQRYFSVEEFTLDLMEAAVKGEEKRGFFKRLFGR